MVSSRGFGELKDDYIGEVELEMATYKIKVTRSSFTFKEVPIIKDTFEGEVYELDD
jgi:hypothetical protein